MLIQKIFHQKVYLNGPCPCGSGIKYKRCCFADRHSKLSKRGAVLRDVYAASLKQTWLAVVLLSAAVLTAYHDGFFGVFLLDDVAGIVENTRIRSLWPLWNLFEGNTRPVTDITFALNYAFGGLEKWGYHSVNIIIHLAASIILYAIVRRTLARDVFSSDTRSESYFLALAVSLLWATHPLQTQSVMYLVQRSEILMGLFYLLTLYSAIRWLDSGRPAWLWGSVIFCLMGVGSKAVMVTAPILVYCYDIFFIRRKENGESFSRVPLFLGYTVSWGALVVLLKDNPAEHASAGFHVEGMSVRDYLLTQPGVILHYLKLAFWPHPLVIDYQWPIAREWFSIVAPSAVLLIFMALTFYGISRCRAWAFPGVWFFLILLPSSSFIPVLDLAFEHRMYLPLAAVLILLAAGIWFLASKWGASASQRRLIAGGAFLILIFTGIAFTIRRNEDYKSEIKMWTQNTEARPASYRARNNLCAAIHKEGRLEEAADQCREALRLKPDYAKAHYNLGRILQDQGNDSEAERHYRDAIRFHPVIYPKAENNLGLMLMNRNQLEEAAKHFAEAMPYLVEAHYNMGLVRQRQSRFDEASALFQQALNLRPDMASARSRLEDLAKQKRP